MIVQRNLSWWDMVSPNEPELIAMLQVLYGPDWFRIPNRKWEDLWRLRRGDLNAELGKRRFGNRKRQGGWMVPIGFWRPQGTTPELSNVTHDHTSVAPEQSRIHLAYDSDGAIRFIEGTTLASMIYADLTTQSDDTNNHSSEWWPDQPDVNEGLNWDIQYTKVTETGVVTARRYFQSALVDRAAAPTWHLLDTVSNDHADAGLNGAIVVHRSNGTAKVPETGTGELTVDIDIRATGSGSSVAGHRLDLTVNGT